MKQKTFLWWHYLVPPSILALLTTVAYYSSLSYSFLFDDLPNIINNYDIRFFSPKAMFFANTRWISRLLNQWTYHHWKFNPTAYRVIDLIIHIAAGALLFAFVLLLCSQIKKNRFLRENAFLLATITSGLFLLHPVQTQTVTFITQIRLEGLVVLLSFATLITFTCATIARSPILKTALYSLCGILILFASGTKEIIIVLPPLLMLVDWFFIAEGDSSQFLTRLPIHFLLGGLLYYMIFFKLGSAVKPIDALKLKVSIPNNRGNILTQTAQEKITPLGYLIGQFRVILHYITMFFWPKNLTFDYGLKIPPSFWSPGSLFPFLTLVGILSSGLWLFIKNQINVVSFCIGWFFIAVLPRATIIPSTEFVCDYKTYLASFGTLFLISYLLVHLITILPGLFINTRVFLSNRKYQFILPAILFVSLSYASNERNSVWASRLVFWKDVIEKTEPHTPARAYNNYAVGLVHSGRQQEGIYYLKKSIATDKTYAEPVINLAMQYQLKNDYVKALELYKHSLTLKERHPEMFNNLGLLHLAQKNYDKAEKSFLMALKYRKHYGRAFVNLGKTYQVQNNLEKAREYYAKAINGDYQNISFYYALGRVDYSLKNYKEAIKTLEVVCAQHKDYEQATELLAACYYNTNQLEKAIPYFEQIYRKSPQKPLHCYNYAQSLMQTKRYKEALPLFMKCEKVQNLVHAPLHVIKCLHQVGKTNLAKTRLSAFIKTTKHQALKKMGADLMKEIGGTLS